MSGIFDSTVDLNSLRLSALLIVCADARKGRGRDRMELRRRPLGNFFELRGRTTSYVSLALSSMNASMSGITTLAYWLGAPAITFQSA